MRFLGTWGKFEDPVYNAFTDDMLDACVNLYGKRRGKTKSDSIVNYLDK